MDNREWLSAGGFYVRHSHSTGSTMEGTRRHVWVVSPWTGGYFGYSSPGTIYDTAEEAQRAADRMTAKNEEP